MSCFWQGWLRKRVGTRVCGGVTDSRLRTRVKGAGSGSSVLLEVWRLRGEAPLRRLSELTQGERNTAFVTSSVLPRCEPGRSDLWMVDADVGACVCLC